MLRRWIFNLHMYGGLLVCGNFILLGVSALQFNHHFLPDAGSTVVWEEDLPQSAATTQPEAVREALGLFGYIRTPTVKRPVTGGVSFVLDRPGRTYTIDLAASGHAKVTEIRRPWMTMQALHGLSSVPGSRLLSAWGVYTEIATLFGLFAPISGVYLFASVKRDRRNALVVLGLSVVVSVSAMCFMASHG